MVCNRGRSQPDFGRCTCGREQSRSTDPSTRQARRHVAVHLYDGLGLTRQQIRRRCDGSERRDDLLSGPSTANR
jgi:hypothetical protein